MVISGGWRFLVGALILSATVTAPAVAHAESVVCESWTEVELPVPDAVRQVGVTGAAGAFAVGSGSFKHLDGTTVLIWKGGTLVDQLTFGRSTTWAYDVNSTGVVILSSPDFRGASRWQDGQYTTLHGYQGEYRVQAIDVNERGDVLGSSDGKVVVWPAGTSQAQLVPGTTDGSWLPIGIADDGTVLASTSTGTYWLGAAGAVQLAGGTEVEAKAVRGSYAVGNHAQKVVHWDLAGQSGSSFVDAVAASDVNSAGQVLGETAWGGTAVWSDADHYTQLSSTNVFGELTEEGDVYGTRALSSQDTYPVWFKCAGGGR